MRSMCRIVLLMLLLLPVDLSAQVKVNNDSLLSYASSLARNGNYTEARDMVLAVARNDSSRTDALLMLANLNLWMGDAKTALTWIEKAAGRNASGPEFYSGYFNILVANAMYSELLTQIDKAIANGYTDELNLIQKKMLAHQELGNYSEAMALYYGITNERIKQHPSVVTQVDKMLDMLDKKSWILHYNFDLFSNTNPQHFVSVGYLRKPTRNSFGINLNYANRFSLSDFQLDATAYLYVAKSRYFYVNYGVGINNSLFPRHRSGVEYYFPLSTKTEASLGGRYMTYTSIVTSNVYILTGHLGRYIGKGWIAARPFWVINDQLQSFSLSMKYRHYGARLRDFWGLELVVGNSPDDMYSISQNGFNNLKSYKLRFEKSWRIDSNSDLVFAPAYSYEQFAKASIVDFRSRFGVEFNYRF